jgi:hypothetical protein
VIEYPAFPSHLSLSLSLGQNVSGGIPVFSSPLRQPGGKLGDEGFEGRRGVVEVGGRNWEFRGDVLWNKLEGT